MASLASLLPQFGFRAEVFFQGEFCARNQFSEDAGVGHLHLITKGAVTMEHDHLPDLEVKVPSLVIYPRPYPHKLVVPSTPAELICATISFKNFDRNPLAKLLPPYVAVPLDDLNGISATVQLLVDEAATEEDGKREVMDRLCDILIIRVFRHMLRKGSLSSVLLRQVPDMRIANVVSEIQDAPAREWTLEKMAQVASMSRSNFAKRFHEAMGMPPAAYVTDTRLTVAAALLQQHRSVKETAQAVGYNSPPAFTKAFTAKYGLAPLKWLSQQAKTPAEIER